MSFATELQEVCGKLDRRDVTREAFVAACGRLITLHVGCDRSGVWTLLDAASGPVLHCLGIYDALTDGVVKVADLSVGLDCFVDVLQRDAHVIADDARAHPATKDWWLDSSSGHDIVSMMAVSFSVNGRLSGVFTCSQVGECMHWSASQLALLKRAAARASLSLASATSFTMVTLPAPLVELPPLAPPEE